MGAKLKSITKQIHWSLVARAVVFAFGWLYLPFWLFFLIGLYCYLVPLFHAKKLAIPFAVLMMLCLVQAPGLLMALIFGVLFYYLLLIKDLLVIDRTAARALLVMALSFLLFREFYATFTKGPGTAGLFFVLLVALAISLLLDNLIISHIDSSVRFPEALSLTIDYSDISAFPVSGTQINSLRRATGLLSFVLTAQCLIIGLFLPLDFIYQSVIVFLVVVICIDLIPEYFFGTLSLGKIRTTSMVIFSLLVVVIASARWGL